MSISILQSDPIWSGSHVTIILGMTLYAIASKVLPKLANGKQTQNGARYAADAALRREEMRQAFTEVVEDKIVPLLQQIAANTLTKK